MNIINKIYRCKNTILDMLDIRGYNTEKYKNFSLNEIDVMYKSMEKKVSSEPNGLDFECIKDEANSYIKFILHTKLRLANLKTLVDNMIEDYVKSGETIIFVVKDKINNIESFDTFLNNYLSPIMVFWVNKVKYLRIYYNFAVPKWYQKIN